jgi:hypothetical protein
MSRQKASVDGIEAALTLHVSALLGSDLTRCQDAREAHNPEVTGSNPVPATNAKPLLRGGIG